ncbi:hypothetical protein D9613_012438 [Agrocybe pediades]|uniref:Aminoglycoside phosphotransferase domain-containing protein n=1 Tax=Agrocybe pediades TaxID=84607 RepID=A0A8H4QRE3_9AGAR|nr:hypothetical protein D9613_012438 [Agrocybe pediades]
MVDWPEKEPPIRYDSDREKCALTSEKREEHDKPERRPPATTVPGHPELPTHEKEAGVIAIEFESSRNPSGAGCSNGKHAATPSLAMPRLATKKLRGIERAKYHARCKIARLLRLPRYGDAFVLLDRKTIAKVGNLANSKCKVRVQETRTMDYIANSTTIPVLRVYGVFIYRRCIHIVQELMPGDVLQDVWRFMTEEDKRSCMQQLRGYVDQLRSLEPPHPGRVEAVDGRGVIDSRLFPYEYGPFPNHEEFHRYIFHEYRVEPMKKMARKTWKTKFSHGDLGMHNIMWKDGRITAIIDWERSGWFPEYWEYTKVYAGCWSEFWEMYQQVMDRYPDELEVDDLMNGYFARV